MANRLGVEEPPVLVRRELDRRRRVVIMTAGQCRIPSGGRREVTPRFGDHALDEKTNGRRCLIARHPARLLCRVAPGARPITRGAPPAELPVFLGGWGAQRLVPSALGPGKRRASGNIRCFGAGGGRPRRPGRGPVATKCASMTAVSCGISPRRVLEQRRHDGSCLAPRRWWPSSRRGTRRARQAPFSYSSVGTMTTRAPLLAVSAWIASRLEMSWPAARNRRRICSSRS